MSNGDWVLYNTGLGGIGSPILTPPEEYKGIDTQQEHVLSGTWTLRIANDVDDGVQSINYVPGDEIDHGFLHGRIRTQIEFSDEIPLHTSPNMAGVTCLQSQEDLRPGEGGLAYAFVMEDIIGNPNGLSLYEVTDGIDFSFGGGPPTSLVQLGALEEQWEVGIKYTIELEWHVDLLSLKGVHLTARFAESSEEELTTIFDIVYNGTSAYKPSSSITEGIVCTATTNTTLVYMDKTEVFELT